MSQNNLGCIYSKHTPECLNGWVVLRYTTNQLRHTPWEITRDLVQLIGAPTNGQAILCFEGVKVPTMRMQRRLA